MPLSEDLRNELAAVVPRAECDRLAELSGLAYTAGRMHLRGRGRVSVHLDLPSSAVARRAFSLVRGFGLKAEIRTYEQRAFGRPTRYELHLGGDARSLQVLHEAGVLSAGLAPLERPPKRVVARACCRRSYLRGALLGAGSLTGPRSAHLEIRTSSVEGGRFLADLVEAEGAHLSVRDRGRHAIAYAKGVEAIADVLAAAGASDSALVLGEHAVVGATRARANRLANADHANLVRSSRAAHVQVQAVKRLADAGRLGELSPPLRQVAQLRLEHPSLSLRELALKTRPPATKAAIHRRLRKIIHLAER